MFQQIKFVLTFSINDQTLVETCTVALHFGLDICQIKLEQVTVCSFSDRLSPLILSTAVHQLVMKSNCMYVDVTKMI